MVTLETDTNPNFVIIFRPWITRNGVRIYHPEGKMWKLEIPVDKFRG